MPNIQSSINFGLVNIPVRVNPIIRNNDTSFNQLHDKCFSRINYIKFCPKCNTKIKETEIIKGYQYEKDDYIVFEKEELNKLKPENEKEIDIISFVSLDEIDPIYKLVALAKTVIGSKFYYVILRFSNQNIIMTTLYFEEEVNIRKDEVNHNINDKELELAMKLITSLKGKFEPDKYKDEYQNNIKKAIEDKVNGKKVKGVKKKSKKQISDLMEALEKSLKK